MNIIKALYIYKEGVIKSIECVELVEPYFEGYRDFFRPFSDYIY